MIEETIPPGVGELVRTVLQIRKSYPFPQMHITSLTPDADPAVKALTLRLRSRFDCHLQEASSAYFNLPLLAWSCCVQLRINRCLFVMR